MACLHLFGRLCAGCDRCATTRWRYTETAARRYPHTIQTENPWGLAQS